MANSKDDIRLRVGYDIDQNSLKQVTQSLQELQKIGKNSFSGNDKELIQMKDLAK